MSQDIVTNRILGQLSADERKSVEPWLTRVDLRTNLVLHEQRGTLSRGLEMRGARVSAVAGVRRVEKHAPRGDDALSVVEDRHQLLAVRTGPVDRQLRDDLVDRGDHGAGLLQAAQSQVITIF